MKKILLVDDEAGFCEATKRNLELAGAYEVTTCSDSTRAAGLAKALRPDLVLLDVLMPGLSGPEVAEKLKESECTRDIPVAFLTAVAAGPEARDLGNRLGAQCFIEKPVRVAELVQAVESVIREFPVKRQAA